MTLFNSAFYPPAARLEQIFIEALSGETSTLTADFLRSCSPAAYAGAARKAIHAVAQRLPSVCPTRQQTWPTAPRCQLPLRRLDASASICDLRTHLRIPRAHLIF